MTALGIACKNENLGLCTLLLSNGASAFAGSCSAAKICEQIYNEEIKKVIRQFASSVFSF